VGETERNREEEFRRLRRDWGGRKKNKRPTVAKQQLKDDLLKNTKKNQERPGDPESGRLSGRDR
jgi:hypothetical protein